MRMLFILLVALLLASCGAAATPAATSPTTAPTTAAPAPTQAPTQAPAAAATTGPAGTVVAPDSPQAKALAAVAQQLGVDLTALQIQNVEEQEWPDSSLGCPAEGMMYTQVITPGFKIVVTDGTKTYEIHTDQTGQRAVLCENGVPVELGAGS